MEIKNLSSSVEKCFMSEHSEQVKYFSTLEDKFSISQQPCNFLFIMKHSQYITTFVAIFQRFQRFFKINSNARQTFPNVSRTFPDIF